MNKIHQEFEKHLEDRNLKKIIKLLVKYIHKNPEDIDERAWAHWNISDVYARIRNVEPEYLNHMLFFEWGKEHLHKEKLHWIVSDGTQGGTLAEGGFFNFWWNCYMYANEYSPKIEDNQNIRFESHRATLSVSVKFSEKQKAYKVIKNMKEFIKTEKLFGFNKTFIELSFQTLQIEYYNKFNEKLMLEDAVNEIIEMINKIIINNKQNDKKENKNQAKNLLGSWSQLNQKRTIDSFLTILHNLGCTLARINKYSQADQVFKKAISCGHELNLYGTAMYLISNWETYCDKSKIINILKEKGKLNNNDYKKRLIKMEPQLKDLIEG